MLYTFLFPVRSIFHVVMSEMTHASFVNQTPFPLSHSWLILNKSCLRPSTNATESMMTYSFEINPYPIVYTFLSSPKVMLGPALSSNSMSRLKSPVMCLEHPLSKYHKIFLFPCIHSMTNSFWFWYPSCLGSWFISRCLRLSDQFFHLRFGRW